MAWSLSGRDFVLGIVVGAVAAVVIGTAAFAAVLRSTNAYGLGHWKLNVRAPLDSMWMNLGFWKTSDGKPVRHFDEACLGLLREILKTAELTGEAPHRPPDPRRSLSILDLGFGCGDQTWALARLLRPQSSHNFRYVGLTLDASQLRTALRTLHRELASSANVDPVFERDYFHLYCANAAKPNSWTPTVRSSVQGLAVPKRTETWLLALDCLYHFSPSRKPVFQYAAQELGANVMAFDLILNENASQWERLLVRAVGLMMSCPLRTFLTEDQYRAQMSECGYDKDGVIIRDISDNVYDGVAKYLDRQEEALSLYGISIGGFKLAGRLFDWFDKSRVVKASIVVARIKEVENQQWLIPLPSLCDTWSHQMFHLAAPVVAPQEQVASIHLPNLSGCACSQSQPWMAMQSKTSRPPRNNQYSSTFVRIDNTLKRPLRR